MAAYRQIKSEVEGIMAYLKKKREEDPYRSIIQRALFQATYGPSSQIPTFELWICDIDQGPRVDTSLLQKSKW